LSTKVPPQFLPGITAQTHPFFTLNVDAMIVGECDDNIINLLGGFDPHLNDGFSIRAMYGVTEPPKIEGGNRILIKDS
jgi:hypothetical protein